MFFRASHSGSDIQDVNTAIAEGKNAVENNGLSWAAGGLGGDFIGLSPETGANYEGILHASAASYLTQEETYAALDRLVTGKDMPNGSDYVELWMRAPEQIGAFLPGPISAAMAALAMADKSLTDTDKADLISVLNKATGDYLSGADSESLLELNTVLSRLGAKSSNKQFQDFIKEKVENNVAKSQKGNKSSKFCEHLDKEAQLAGKGTAGDNISHLTAEQQQIIKNAESISTAKTGKQVTVPRDLNEQIFWKQVQNEPTSGRILEGMNNDARFPESAGFQKMEAVHKLPDGSSITIHYQYNTNTGKAYDMKITTPKPKWPQPGTSLTGDNK